VLRTKGIEITDQEYQAVCIAILLHDMGHGPYSHALEHRIIGVHHEFLSLKYLQTLNREYNGELSLAIDIFKGEYHKGFLHQLVSGQLDLDRMDYLNRDSFFTGVAEGVIGYDRIIEMLHVVEDELVVEEKGIYSIEKFLMARRIMYWQVYLHRVSISTEQMLIMFFDELKQSGADVSSKPLKYFLQNEIKEKDINEDVMSKYSLLDDFDISFAIKELKESNNKVLQYLSRSILDRKIFTCKVSETPIKSDFVEEVRQKFVEQSDIASSEVRKLFRVGKEEKSAYSQDKQEIKILLKDGTVVKYSETSDFGFENANTIKYFLCHPRLIC